MSVNRQQFTGHVPEGVWGWGRLCWIIFRVGIPFVRSRRYELHMMQVHWDPVDPEEQP